MTGLDQYLEKIYNNCKIPFKAYIDGKVVFEADPVYFQSEVEEDDFCPSPPIEKIPKSNNYEMSGYCFKSPSP